MANSNNLEQSVQSLPLQSYYDSKNFEDELKAIWQNEWIYACHEKSLKEPLSFITLKISNYNVVILRDKNSELVAYLNTCRHRGSILCEEDSGKLKRNLLVCQYHQWSYNVSDGKLVKTSSFEIPDNFNPDDHTLHKVQIQIWNGLIFIRFLAGPQNSVASILARFDAEIAPYDLESMLPTDSNSMHDTLPVNWKSVRDVDNEGYHVRQAHPGLHELYGNGYFDEPFVDGTSRSVGTFNEAHGNSWSVRKYRDLLPKNPDLPEAQNCQWIYFGMFPNLVLGLYPDSIIFYQDIPQSATETIQRGMCYRRSDEDRQMKVARYLSGRIDRDTADEDQMLMVWSCEATKSSAYDGVLFSDLEYGVKTYHDHLRNLLPVMGRPERPLQGQMAEDNHGLLKKGA